MQQHKVMCFIISLNFFLLVDYVLFIFLTNVISHACILYFFIVTSNMYFYLVNKDVLHTVLHSCGSDRLMIKGAFLLV